MAFPHFVWLINGWYPNQWWRGIEGTCSDSDIEQALEKSLVVNHFPYLSSRTAPTDPGLVSGACGELEHTRHPLIHITL